MSVMKAINGHAKHVFRRYVDERLAEHQMTMRDFIVKTYGKYVVSNVYPILSGKTALTEKRAREWANTLNVSEEDLYRAYEPMRKIIESSRSGRPIKKETVAAPSTALRDHVSPLLEERGLTLTTFSRALGQKSSAPIWSILNGRTRLTDTMAERFAQVLEVTPDSLKAARPKHIVSHYQTKKARRASRETSDEVRVSPNYEVLEARAVSSRRGETSNGASEISPERFSLSVNADGTASVRLHLPVLPLAQALKLVASLGLPELISSQSQLKITHESGKKTG